MLLFLLAGAVIAILAASYYVFRSAPTPPTSTTQPAAAPATRPAASAPTAHTRASPAPRSTAPPLTSTQRWLTGLSALQAHTNQSDPPNGAAVTPAALPV